MGYPSAYTSAMLKELGYAMGYCDGDGDAATLGGYGPQIVDAVYTLAKALDTMEAADRQDPEEVFEAIEDLGDFEGFSGTVSRNDYEERDGPMTIVNLQLSNITAIIQSTQTADYTIMAITGKTCGMEFFPKLHWNWW